MNRIKQLALAVSVLSSGIASAGTMGPVSTETNWTGFYLGANAGGFWGESRFNWNPEFIPSTEITAPGFLFLHTISSAAHTTLNDSGFTGGGQVGYNYQMNKLLLGIEGDINYADFSVSRGVSTGTPLDPDFVLVADINQSISTDWFSTVRGRIGFVNNNWVLYGTGGWAVARMNVENQLNTVGLPTQNSSFNQTQNGWTAGAGAEWKFAPNWSAKLEYLYIDLGKQTVTSRGLFENSTDLAIAQEHDFSANVARVGINYMFG